MWYYRTKHLNTVGISLKAQWKLREEEAAIVVLSLIKDSKKGENVKFLIVGFKKVIICVLLNRRTNKYSTSIMRSICVSPWRPPQPPHRPCQAYVTSSRACAVGRLIPSQVWAGPSTQSAAVQQDTAHMERGKIWRWAQTVSSDLFVTHYNHTEHPIISRPCNYVLCKLSWGIFLLHSLTLVSGQPLL